MTTFDRFEVEAAAIPIHPQPTFFETTRVAIGDGHAYVDHKRIETILTRPKWNFLAADRKARATAYSKRASATSSTTASLTLDVTRRP